MYRYFFIAKNNMKKQKKDMITFAVMTFLASFMIFICLMMLIGTFRVMDTNQKQINGADIIILLKCDDPVLNFKLREIIQGNKKLTQYESTKYLSVQGKYRKKGTHNWSEYPFDICSYDDERNVQTTSVDTEGFSGKDILLPVYMSTFFSVGDIMQLKIEDNQYEFRVAGFNEDFLYSSPMNMGIYLVYISGEYYENIEFENPEYAIPGRNVKMKFTRAALKNHADASEEADNIYSELNTWVQSYKKEHPEYHGDVYGNFIPAELMKTASMIMPFIFVAFLLVFALIILLIAFVIIDFSVKNFILDNMKNTGIMEAGGYTVSELILILLTQLLSVALVGSLSGVILGAALQEKIGGIMLFLLGLNWNQQASFSLMASVLIGISLVITVFTLVLGREYKKTNVLDALRGGINTHNFKRNFFPFDKTHLPVALTLALKETFGKFRNQIGVVLIMGVLAFAAAMGFGMYENMGKDTEVLLRLAGMELPNAMFYGDSNMEENIRHFKGVDYLYSENSFGLEYRCGKKVKQIMTKVLSDTSLMDPDMMVEGRWPRYNNEIALATMTAYELGVGIGDTVRVINGDDEASYLVCGMMQTFSNLGQMGYLTNDGYEKIGRRITEGNIQIFMKNGYGYAQLEKEFKAMYPDTELTDVYATTGSMFDLLKVSLKAIVVIIMLITALIVALAEALLVRTQITRSWRNLGVSKALGFTSDQLILQVMVSNIPPILIGIVMGLIAATMYGGKVMLAMFAMFGFKKIHFELSLSSYVLVTLVILGVAVLISWNKGKRIKNLEPVKMITEE